VGYCQGLDATLDYEVAVRSEAYIVETYVLGVGVSKTVGYPLGTQLFDAIDGVLLRLLETNPE
jgi:hypothetical protein